MKDVEDVRKVQMEELKKLDINIEVGRLEQRKKELEEKLIRLKKEEVNYKKWISNISEQRRIKMEKEKYAKELLESQIREREEKRKESKRLLEQERERERKLREEEEIKKNLIKQELLEKYKEVVSGEASELNLNIDADNIIDKFEEVAIEQPKTQSNKNLGKYEVLAICFDIIDRLIDQLPVFHINTQPIGDSGMDFESKMEISPEVKGGVSPNDIQVEVNPQDEDIVNLEKINKPTIPKEPVYEPMEIQYNLTQQPIHTFSEEASIDQLKHPPTLNEEVKDESENKAKWENPKSQYEVVYDKMEDIFKTHNTLLHIESKAKLSLPIDLAVYLSVWQSIIQQGYIANKCLLHIFDKQLNVNFHLQHLRR